LRTMAKKPANLIYGVDDKPPRSTLLLLGLQHVSVMSVGWIFVVVIVTGMEGTSQQAASVIQMSMIVSGIATVLQAQTKGPVGSGYLCPLSCGPAYIAASISAGKVGGGKIAAEIRFDEFNLDVDLRYDGVLMEFPRERPTQADVLSDETGVAKLAGFLIRNYVDRIKSDCVDGRCRVQFHFDH
jgi:hypothetical protein